MLLHKNQTGAWIAYDGAIGADNTTLYLRQAAFRCRGENITEPGWHKWQINNNARKDAIVDDVIWSEKDLWFETRRPEEEDSSNDASCV